MTSISTLDIAQDRRRQLRPWKRFALAAVVALGLALLGRLTLWSGRSPVVSAAQGPATPTAITSTTTMTATVSPTPGLPLPTLALIAIPRALGSSVMVAPHLMLNLDLPRNSSSGLFQGVAVFDPGQSPTEYALPAIDASFLLQWISPDADATTSVAWGDVDGDGDLDLAVGNKNAANRLYINQGGRLNPDAPAAWTSSETDDTSSLAWGDVDGDGDLDLVVGNRPRYRFSAGSLKCSGGQERLYRNDDGKLTASAVWSSRLCDESEAVALGDVDGDGDLDLAVANQPGRDCRSNTACEKGADLVYRNDRGKFGEAPSWSSKETGPSMDLAWVDVDGDGHLDLSVAGSGSTRVYLGNGSQLANSASFRAGSGTSVSPFDGSLVETTSFKLAWGDVDRDGDPDLVTAGPSEVALYRNDGGRLGPTPVWQPLDQPPLVQSLALGDADADGDLDLALGASCSESPETCALQIYKNDAGQFTLYAEWKLEDALNAFDLAWGDVDNDGDLDLAAGVGGYVNVPNRLYRNLASLLLPDQPLQPPDPNYVTALAWGDVDGDRDLDLAVGSHTGSDAVYLNEGGSLQPEPDWRSLESDQTSALAWGDVDGDGDLDLAAAHLAQCDISGLASACQSGRLRLYRNEGGRLLQTAVWSSAEADNTTSLAWGDVDGDGDLDLAAGNGEVCSPGLPVEESCLGAASRLYLNQDGMLGEHAAWSTAFKANTQSVAWGDVDNDGDLDLALGNFGQPSHLYANEAGTLTARPVYSTTAAARTTSLAWGDVDGDGDLDLAAGSEDEPVRLYRNDGGKLAGRFTWSMLEVQMRPNLAWGDVDGDGDLDLAVYDPFKGSLYLNENGVLAGNAAWTWDSHPQGGSRWVADDALAWGDVDNDGDLDLATGQQLLRNRRSDRLAQAGQSVLHLQYPGPGDEAAFYAQAGVLDSPIIPITYTLAVSPTLGPPVDVRGFYAFKGNDWKEAKPVSTSSTANLSEGSHVYAWNVAADGLMGRSDGVVFRLQAIPRQVQAAAAAASPQLYGSSSAATSPFPLGGSKVQVVDASTGKSAAGAIVYKLDAGQVSGANWFGAATEPLRTNADGYLLGQDRIRPGDGLVALWPVRKDTEDRRKYTLYYTSARPTGAGLDAYRVTGPGVQKLEVSRKNPLILFDLDVSLEWDARNDATFLEELAQSIQRTSEILYDVTNGQMALGEVRVWQDKQNWLRSDVVIYASGSVRPRASLGGMVDKPTDDVDRYGKTIPQAFLPGQVRLGPGWDPFGQSRADLGRDWWRALAHELAHHLLYLPDNYLGYGKNGNIKKVDCYGSIMTTAYDDAYSELLEFNGKKPDQWPGECKDTLAAKTTGRSDWETLQRFYPAVITPTKTLSGPVVLPLNVTRVQVIDPSAEAASTYPARNFDLRDQGGNRLVVPQGQGYLIRNGGNQDPTDDILMQLGSTGLADYIKVRGAADGDELCVFDFNSNPVRLGCIRRLNPLTNTIHLAEAPGWLPNVQVAPAQQPALAIKVSQPFTGSAASLTAIPAQPGVAVTATRLSTATLLQVDAAGDAYDFSVTISHTGAIAPAAVIQRTGSSLAITATGPGTPGAPAIISISRPALLVTVTQAITDGELYAQVLPAYGRWSSNAVRLEPTAGGVRTAAGVYSALVPLEAPVYAGFARVWSLPSAPPAPPGEAPASGEDAQAGRGGRARRDAISPFFFAASRQPDRTYTWGDGPGVNLGAGFGPNDRGGFGPNDRGGFGPNDRGGFGPDVRGFNANRRAMGAPIASSDGQVTIFNSRDVLGDTATTSLQALPAAPGLPAYLTPVGQAYRFTASDEISRTIEFGYLQREVPQGYEHTLVVYFSGDEGVSWQRLPTDLAIDDNQATAPAGKSGIYVLASAVEVPFYSAGWNLFAYPIAGGRPVIEALRSISGTYSTIYGYDSANSDDPWQIYDVRAPAWANDLTKLEFGRGYWINVSRPITLQLQVESGAPISPTSVVALSQPVSRRTPPAVYYGSLPANSEGVVVTAWVEDHLCGQAEAKADQGRIVYAIKVDAADEGPRAGCGAPGKDVLLKLGKAVASSVSWNNTAPIQVDLKAP